MTAPFKTWKVLPHGKLTEVDDNILTVVGAIHMPIGDLPRRMTVVRLGDGRLVIYSAIALGEPEMIALEAYGTPAFLVVPGDHHRLDAGVWKDRYPALHVVTPEGARDKVAEVVRVDDVALDFGVREVRLIDVPGTRQHEAALEIEGVNGSTLVVNDIIANIRGEHGFGGWLLRLMNFAGDEPHIPGPIMAAIVRDKAELSAQLLRWADLPNLKRILVSHGEPIEADAPGVLRKLAASLE